MKKPTLVIWGYNDPTATLAQGLTLFDLITARTAKAQLHIFNQAGHFTYREHPKAFNELIRCFVQEA